MSTAPSVPLSPFEPVTTPTIERANRLMSVRTNPGFLDILRISQEIVQSAADTARDYPGWDLQQMLVLKVRSQVAKEHHDLLLAKINEAIREGIDERKRTASTVPAKTPTEVLEQGDLVRQEVLTKFDEMDDMRAAGSYEPAGNRLTNL